MENEYDKVISDAVFSVKGASYVGSPVSDSAMYITNKVQHLLDNLYDVDNCLIFAESGMIIPDLLQTKHRFVFADNPQLTYAKFAEHFNKEKQKKENAIPFDNVKGAYISQKAVVARDAYIEPGCVIGPGVIIGENACLLAGCVIKNAVIGANFIANEYAVIGSNGFTMATDTYGNKCRIPSLGKVKIGDNVEIGAHDNISRGSAGDTVIDDNVKLDALVHIGHDVHLYKNVEITAGSIIGGFDTLEDNVYIGLNSSLRNRITIGEKSIVGMGTNVISNVSKKVTVIGNPAQIMKRR